MYVDSLLASLLAWPQQHPQPCCLAFPSWPGLSLAWPGLAQKNMAEDFARKKPGRKRAGSPQMLHPKEMCPICLQFLARHAKSSALLARSVCT